MDRIEMPVPMATLPITIAAVKNTVRMSDHQKSGLVSRVR